jgi:hydroxypyruvate isomerase
MAAHIRQSASWWCFVRGETTPRDILRAAADIGYEAMDLVPQEQWQLVKDHGLVISGVAGHASLTDGLNRRENHDRIERELRANLALAAQWGIPNLICFSGNRNGLDDTSGAEITAEGLRRVAAMAEDVGVNLIVELLNSKVNHPDYQCDHTAWGRAVCEMVGSPRVKLLYDIYHMQVMEGDIIRTIQEHNALFSLYHTAGNPGRHDLDDAQELAYPAIMKAVLATGYDGYVAHEFVPKGDPRAALKAAYDVCNVTV